jgi:hypothetical protein
MIVHNILNQIKYLSSFGGVAAPGAEPSAMRVRAPLAFGIGIALAALWRFGCDADLLDPAEGIALGRIELK